MNVKSRFLKSLTIGLVATSFMASAVLAQTNMTAETIARLEGLGYTQFQVSRTFFGRVKINALSTDMAREIVMNQHTGEILREVDMTARIDEMRAMMSEESDGTMGGTSGASGPGNGGSNGGSNGGNNGGNGGNGGNSGGMGG